jgi:hypothetical protein
MNIYKPPKQKSYSFSKKNPIPIISYKINFKSSSKSKINKINGQNDYNINKTPYKRKIIHSSNNSRDFSNTINTTINSNNRYSDFNNNNLIINNNETHRSFITNISEFNFEDEENEKNNNLNNNNNFNKTNKLKKNKVKKISFINLDKYLKDIDNNNYNINNNNKTIDINNFNSNNNDKYLCENNNCEKCFVF